MLVNTEETQWHALLRFGDLNRGGAPDIRNTLTSSIVEISSIDLTHSRTLDWGRIEIGVGYQRIEDPLSSEDISDARAFLTWRSR